MNDSDKNNGLEGADNSPKETQLIPPTHLRYMKQLERYFGIQNPVYDVTRKYDGQEFKFDLYDPKTNQLVKVFTEIDPVEMTDYASIPVREEIILLIDTECLPEEEFEEAEKFHGIPPKALMAAIKVDARLFHNGLIMEFAGSNEGGHIYDASEYRARELDLPMDE